MRGVIVSKCPCKGYPFADRISEAFRTHFDNKSIRFRSTTKVPVQSSTITTTTTTTTTRSHVGKKPWGFRHIGRTSGLMHLDALLALIGRLHKKSCK